MAAGHDKLYLVEEYWNMPGSPADGYSTGTMGGLMISFGRIFRIRSVRAFKSWM